MNSYDIVPYYVRPMNNICPYCSALRFPNEPLSCCYNGKVSLPLLSRYPEELKDLLLSNGPQAKGFREHIRQYNSAFALTLWDDTYPGSMASRVETRFGYPGYPDHNLSRSSGSRPLYKISGSDPESAHRLIKASSPDQNDELSMLDGDYGNISSRYFKQITTDCCVRWVDCTIRVLWSFGAWIMQSYTPWKYGAAACVFNEIQISLFGDHS